MLPTVISLSSRRKTEKGFAESPSVVLLDSTSVNVSELGSGTFVIRRVIQVNNEKGALANRVIKYDYDPLTAAAEFAQMKMLKCRL